MKLDKIRLATEQEVAEIAKGSDLTPMSKVLAMGDMRAVWRITNEIDPMFFGNAADSKKYLFVWGLENVLRGTGATEFYFNVPVADNQYQKIVEHFGAIQTSKEPEYRYKVTL